MIALLLHACSSVQESICLPPISCLPNGLPGGQLCTRRPQDLDFIVSRDCQLHIPYEGRPQIGLLVGEGGCFFSRTDPPALLPTKQASRSWTFEGAACSEIFSRQTRGLSFPRGSLLEKCSSRETRGCFCPVRAAASQAPTYVHVHAHACRVSFTPYQSIARNRSRLFVVPVSV